MPASVRFLNPSEAARRLGVSAKALRLYEHKGLLAPSHTAAGWRVYGPDEMRRAREIAELRTLGFPLAGIARLLNGDGRELDAALAAHQSAVQERLKGLAATLAALGSLRSGLSRSPACTVRDLMRGPLAARPPAIAFDLPWPWGGERFEMQDIKPLTYIVGPLGSGKTRLALRLAETLPNAAFLGLERLSDGAAWRDVLAADPALRARVEHRLEQLVGFGARLSDVLKALVAGLEAGGSAYLVIDMIEQGLDEPSQRAVARHLRFRAPGSPPLFMLTRSRAILDLANVGGDEAVILCPANHSPPALVAALPGFPGYEAVASCLASPEVRARTEGVIAWRSGHGSQPAAPSLLKPADM